MGDKPRTGYPGVTYRAEKRKWRARVKVDYKEHSLGSFDTEDEAIEAVVRFTAGLPSQRYRQRCIADGQVRCSECGVTKPIDEFYMRNGKPRASCKPCELAGTAKWRQDNVAHLKDYNAQQYPERREYFLEYAQANKDHRRELARAWWDSVAARNLRRKHEGKRRAAKRRAFVEHVDPQTAYAIYGGRCHICGLFIVGAFHVDHVQPLARGGQHSYANCRPAHPRCNLVKHAKLPAALKLAL